MLGLVGWTVVLLLRAASPDALTLEDARATAVKKNTMLQIARQHVKAAEAGRLQTGGGFLPSIRLSQGWTRSSDAVNAFGFRLKQEQFTAADFDVARLNEPGAITNFQTKLAVQQPVYNGGSSISRRRQATEGVRAAEASLEHAMNNVRYQTARAYWGQVLAYEALQAVRDGLETARSHARVAEALYREQTIPLSDLLAARVRVAELEEEAITAESRVATAGEALTLVMGLEADASPRPTDSLVVHSVQQDVATLVSEALQGRPDLKAADHQARAARRGSAAARGNLIPHLNAFFEAGLDSDELFQRSGESWTAGALLTWDLFSGGRTIGGVR